MYELLKFYGRDASISDMWDLFKTIMKKSPNPSKLLGDEEQRKEQLHQIPDEAETKGMFITALTELKYMGYLS
mgnify:CR=1 FL=1